MSIGECLRCGARADLVQPRDYIMPGTWCSTCVQLDAPGYEGLVRRIGTPLDLEPCPCGGRVARDMLHDGRAACIRCGLDPDRPPAPAALEAPRARGAFAWLPTSPAGVASLVVVLVLILVASCRGVLGLTLVLVAVVLAGCAPPRPQPPSSPSWCEDCAVAGGVR